MEYFDLKMGEDNLKAENEFLKMKLMLEQGTQFAKIDKEGKDLPPEIENQFLNNVLAFEKQFAEHKTIKVYAKIGKPCHFKPVAEIPDENMDQAWEELRNYLGSHSIDLSVCSPNITSKELYRFTTEELFEHEMDDIDLPRWVHGFIYDEFHPDPVYDNSRMVKQDLMSDIFRKDELIWGHHYANDGFCFNGTRYDSFEKYRDRINRFKFLYDEMELLECEIDKCDVSGSETLITGYYKAAAKSGNNETDFSGRLSVKLVLGDLGYWDMKEINLEGM